jgi:Integrase core domain
VYQSALKWLILLIGILGFIAASAGIFYQTPGEPYQYTNHRGESVMITGLCGHIWTDFIRIYPEYDVLRLDNSADSRRGNCYDNAPIESFWGILKNELVHHRRYSSRQEATQEITEYIEIFYNRQRRQERLGYLSPAAFEKKYFKELRAA